jgi:hypothetical protein
VQSCCLRSHAEVANDVGAAVMLESIDEEVMVGIVVVIVSVGILNEVESVDTVVERRETSVSKSVVVTVVVDGEVNSLVETRVSKSVKVTVTVGEAEVGLIETPLFEDPWVSKVSVGDNISESVAADEPVWRMVVVMVTLWT